MKRRGFTSETARIAATARWAKTTAEQRSQLASYLAFKRWGRRKIKSNIEATGNRNE